MMKKIAIALLGLSASFSAQAFEKGQFHLDPQPGAEPSACTDVTTVMTLEDAGNLGIVAHLREENVGPCEVFFVGQERAFVKLYEMPMPGGCGGKIYTGSRHDSMDDGSIVRENINILDYRTYTCEIPLASLIKVQIGREIDFGGNQITEELYSRK